MAYRAHAEDHVNATVHELQRRHPERDAAEIERWVLAEYHGHADDAVQAFVTILVTRAVEDRLRRTPPGVLAPGPGLGQ
jgi:hypothetical protein